MSAVASDPVLAPNYELFRDHGSQFDEGIRPGRQTEEQSRKFTTDQIWRDIDNTSPLDTPPNEGFSSGSLSPAPAFLKGSRANTPPEGSAPPRYARRRAKSELKESKPQHEYVRIRMRDDEGRRLQHHYISANKWGYPAGYIETGETARDAAARELLERTGYLVKSEDLRSAGRDSTGFALFDTSVDKAVQVAKPGERGGYKTKVRWEAPASEEGGHYFGKGAAHNDASDKALARSREAIHRLAGRQGVSWDDDPKFMAWSKKITGTPHLDEMTSGQLSKIRKALSPAPAALKKASSWGDGPAEFRGDGRTNVPQPRKDSPAGKEYTRLRSTLRNAASGLTGADYFLVAGSRKYPGLGAEKSENIGGDSTYIGKHRRLHKDWMQQHGYSEWGKTPLK
jgi:8-oxo-dGTP pyrophosphatase MutT (NUDIX family)